VTFRNEIIISVNVKRFGGSGSGDQPETGSLWAWVNEGDAFGDDPNSGGRIFAGKAALS